METTTGQHCHSRRGPDSAGSTIPWPLRPDQACDALTLRGLKRATASALLALLAAAAFTSCSGKENDAVSAESIVTPPERLISSADIAKTALGSPERAFLRHWSALQYSAWSVVLSNFEPALVRFIGAPLLVEALKPGAAYFRTARPMLRGRVRVRDQVIVRFRVQNIAGTSVTSSISWRRTSLGWRIHYDPSLDAMLQASMQEQVQAEIDPTAAQPSKKALQAGLGAFRLQSQYLGAEASLP